MTADYSRDHSELDDALARIERFAGRLADGPARVAAFRHAALVSWETDEYVAERLEVRDGLAVMCVGPGRKMREFLSDLGGVDA